MIVWMSGTTENKGKWGLWFAMASMAWYNLEKVNYLRLFLEGDGRGVELTSGALALCRATQGNGICLIWFRVLSGNLLQTDNKGNKRLSEMNLASFTNCEILHSRPFFILFMGFSRQEYWSGLPFPSPVDHILSDLSTMTLPSWVAPWAWLSFIELDKAVVLGWLDWLVFCEYGFSVSALWCPLATPTVLLGFLLPWAWGIPLQLLQQSAAAAPYLGGGVSPHCSPSWPSMCDSSSRPSCARAATAPFVEFMATNAPKSWLY